ncbi:MAG: DUF502 domain-containing protein [Nitrospinota bacterium]
MLVKVRSKLKKIFFAGILVTLPLALTVFLLQFFFVRLDAQLSPAVTKLLLRLNVPIDPDYRIPGLGLVTIIVIVFLAGLFTRNIIGRKLVDFGEGLLVKIPIFKNIYVGAKQVIETFGKSRAGAFRKVVLIEYPRHGIYSLAFVTNDRQGEVEKRVEQEMVSVFVPTTPNPTSGYFLMLPKKDVVELDMNVEDGIKMVISGGLVTPPEPKNELTEQVKGGE